MGSRGPQALDRPVPSLAHYQEVELEVEQPGLILLKWDTGITGSHLVTCCTTMLFPILLFQNIIYFECNLRNLNISALTSIIIHSTHFYDA